VGEGRKDGIQRYIKMAAGGAKHSTMSKYEETVDEQETCRGLP